MPRAGRGMATARCGNFDPVANTLRALFVAGSQQVGDNIDNITVSPRGGILLCEDGDPVTDSYGPGTRIIGITAEGDSFPFAKNNIDLELEDIAGGRQAHLSERLPRAGMGGRLLRCEGRGAVRQHPDPRHHLRDLGTVGARQPLILKGTVTFTGVGPQWASRQ